jgi:hypothetical protein
MIVIGNGQRGWLNVFKNPADALAPYRARMHLPDGRHYSGRMRSHPDADGGFWYEGFVTALSTLDYAHDQQLSRYPSSPQVAPARFDLLPCQMKISPYSAADDKNGMIGSVWVSRQDGAHGGELFTIFARQRDQGSMVIAGDVLRYRATREHRDRDRGQNAA